MSSKFEYYKKYEPIFGVWELVDLISAESLGSVFKIARTDFGNTFYSALKIITFPQSDAEYNRILEMCGSQEKTAEYIEEAVKSIASELVVMSKLRGHSNIINYEDHVIIPHENGIGKDILIRMELLSPMPGFSVNSFMPEEEVIRLGIDICNALEMCEKHNIVHKDIKPESIFKSNTGSYKLGNFDFARRYINRSADSISSLTYMSPEVHSGLCADIRADIYSLGILLYRLLNKNAAPFMPPYSLQAGFNQKEQAINERFSGKQLPPPCGTTNPELCRAVLKACSFDIDKRYAGAGEMRAELEKALASVSGYAEETVNVRNIAAASVYGVQSENAGSIDSTINVRNATPAINAYGEQTPVTPPYIPPVHNTDSDTVSVNDFNKFPEDYYSDFSNEYDGEKPKKSKKGRIILIIALILLFPALCGVGIYFGYNYYISYYSDDECTHEELLETERGEKEYISEDTYKQTITYECADCGEIIREDIEKTDSDAEECPHENLEEKKRGKKEYISENTYSQTITYECLDCGEKIKKETEVKKPAVTDKECSHENLIEFSRSDKKYTSAYSYDVIISAECDSCGEILTYSETGYDSAAETLQGYGNLTGNLFYRIENDGTLAIVGKGKMPSYEDASYYPWYPGKAGIVSVVIGDGVKSIGNMAFSGFDSLKNVSIADSVTSIGDMAFYSCSALDEISISEYVTDIKTTAFKGSTGLKRFSVDKNNPNYESYSGVLFDKGRATLIQYPAGSVNTNYSIPDTVKTISDGAFSGSKALNKITIPNSVTLIKEQAFLDCENLREITVSYSNDSYCSENGVLFNKNKTVLIQYPAASDLTSYTIPDTVTEIAPYAFLKIKNLTELTAGRAAVITPDAFGETYYALSGKMTMNVYNGSSAQSFANTGYIQCNVIDAPVDPRPVITRNPDAGTVASGSCGASVYWKITSDGILTIYGHGDMTNYTDSTKVPWYNVRSYFSAVIIDNGVTSIGSRAFMNNSSLNQIYISDTVTSVGEYIIYDSDNLQSVYIPASLTYIEKGGFFYSKGIKSFTVSEANPAYKSIDGVLFNKSGTTLIQYPVGDSSKSSYSIPYGVSTVAYGAFGGSKHLTSVYLPNSVTTLSDRAFTFCSALTDITIPDSVSVIEKCVFRNCTALTAIYVHNSNSCFASSSGVLYNKTMTRLMHYPASRPGETYTVSSNVDYIDENAFLSNRYLNEVYIYNSNTHFADRVFKERASDSITHRFKLKVYRGSTAAEHAAKYKLEYDYIG